VRPTGSSVHGEQLPNRAARGGGCGVDRAVSGRDGRGRSGRKNVFVVASVATVSRDVIYTLIV